MPSGGCSRPEPCIDHHVQATQAGAGLAADSWRAAAALSLDAVDVSGEAGGDMSLAKNGELHKLRLNRAGERLSVAEYITPRHYGFVLHKPRAVRPPPVRSRPAHARLRTCCISITAAGLRSIGRIRISIRQGWPASWSLSPLRPAVPAYGHGQAATGSAAQEISALNQAFEDREGCRVSGWLDVQRVAGNFHVAVHMEDYVMLDRVGTPRPPPSRNARSMRMHRWWQQLLCTILNRMLPIRLFTAGIQPEFVCGAPAALRHCLPFAQSELASLRCSLQP